MRLAIETSTPIIPCAVIGAEEQAPTVYNAAAIGKLFGFPAFPITPLHPLIPGLGMLPLPTKYKIYFGSPMQFEGNANDEDEAIIRKVDQVKGAMQRMIDDGLAARDGVFW